MAEFRPSDTRLIYALRRAQLTIEQRKQEMLRGLDLLPSHYAVLINVWAHPGVTGATLARHLGVSPQNVTNLLAKLADRGFVERTRNAVHEHVLEVRLTTAGAAVLEAADAEVAELERQVVTLIGAERAASIADDLSLLADWQSVDGQ